MRMGDYLFNVLSAVIAIDYMDHGFQKKYHGKLRVVSFLTGCGIYFLAVTAFNRIMEFESVMGFLYGVIVICYGLAALEGKKWDILFYGILWMVIVLIGSYAVYGVIGGMTEENLADMVALEWEYQYTASMSVTALKFSMGRIASGIFRKRETEGKAEDWMIAASFLLIFFLVHGIFWLELEIADQRMRYYLTTGIMGGMFGLILLLELFHRKLWKYYRVNLELAYQRDLEYSQKEGLEDLHRMIREMNRFQHDIKGKMDVLRCLLEKERYADMEKYIGDLQGGLTQYPMLPQDTGNDGLNAALAAAMQECREKGIRFHYAVLGSPGKIDSMDMGVLLYNLFRNGMEACMEIPPDRERRLELVLMERKDETELEILNSIGRSVFLENPDLKSGKKDREHHGFGMDSIRRVMKAYHGTYGCREEEDCFIQTIILKHDS